ncbi:MAG: NAD(P)/FAD-dependent oxidoreductase [Selenomonadaceae bacterium]|nr:NAD(P)/FAD-dependent oxidoreductase [Selenomonadaceae bacterium]
MNKRIVIVGGGPAGMMAGIALAEELDNMYIPKEERPEIILLEKMQKCGRKLRITGKGRGNLTNASALPDIIANIPGGGAFLNSSIRAFTNDNVISFFEEADVPTKVERGNRVFPVSDNAEDLVTALTVTARRLGVDIRTASPAAGLIWEDLNADEQPPQTAEATGRKSKKKPAKPIKRIRGVRLRSGEEISADIVIAATGGLSYPATGSSGDGLGWARELGHRVTDTFPALVPLETDDDWTAEATGLALKNVRATLLVDGKEAGQEFGELLFTHFGVSGPIILRLSRKASEALNVRKPAAFVELMIDLKPALTVEQLSDRLDRDLEKFAAKAMKNALVELLPQKLIAPILDLSYIDGMETANNVSRESRKRLSENIKALPLTVTGTRPYTEAIVTAGGVDTDEIVPKSMASKLVSGLYWAGEVINVDGYTGGYNLQAAFSTGHAAGVAAARAFVADFPE